MGIELPQIEVRYEHLSAEADVHVGARAVPTLLNAAINVVEVRTQIIQIILAAAAGLRALALLLLLLCAAVSA